MTHKYQIIAAFGVSLLCFFKIFPVSIKSVIHSLSNGLVPGHRVKKFDYG